MHPKQKKTRVGESKAAEAFARKNTEAAKREAMEAREKDDKYWKEAEGPKSRAALKREERAKKQEEVAARKSETRRLEEEEKMELDKNLNKNKKKVTEAERIKEEEKVPIEKKVEVEKKQSRIKDEKEYKRMVLVKNTNHDESIIEASTFEEAIFQLADPAISFGAFAKTELIRLKEEKPGLLDSQYNDMIDKLWKRSHVNNGSQDRPKRR